MTSALHKYTTEDSYLSQMRELVLKATSDLDCTVFLFGSRARGVYRRSSDIDIGFSDLSEPQFTRLRDHLLSEEKGEPIPAPHLIAGGLDSDIPF